MDVARCGRWPDRTGVEKGATSLGRWAAGGMESEGETVYESGEGVFTNDGGEKGDPRPWDQNDFLQLL